MANEIDAKAEAAGITWVSREDAERGIIDLCTRVRAEAIRETVEKACKEVCRLCAEGGLPADHGNYLGPCFKIRKAFAEPSKEQEQAIGPTTEHQQAVADADHDTKHELHRCVEAFSAGMLAKLMTKKNCAKGDRAGWLAMTADQLHRRLLAEVVELTDAVGRWESVLEIESEAHDVANFAMMIADKARHEMMGEPPRDIGKEIIADLKELNLRQFVDAAVAIADFVGPGFAWCDERCKDSDDCPCPRCTILRLAPQFKEKTNE